MKYVEIALSTFKAQLTYRFDIAVNMLFTVSRILLAHVLWGTIYAGRSSVDGLTLNQMMTYYILSAFVAQLDMSSGSGFEIASRIRGGSFSSVMALPVRPVGFFAAQTAGASAFYFLFNLLAAASWTALFGVRPELATAGLPGAIALIALGLVFMMQLHFFLGILAFRFTDVWMFMMIKDNLLLLATGAMVPLFLMPDWLQAGLRWLPFYYVTYLPSMALMGRLTGELTVGVAVLAVWNACMILLNRVAYQRLRVRYDGVGA